MNRHISFLFSLCGLLVFSACVKDEKIVTYSIGEANLHLLGQPPTEIILKRYPEATDSMCFRFKESRKNYHESLVLKFMGKKWALIEERSYHFVDSRTLQEFEYGLYPSGRFENGEPKFVLRLIIHGFPAGRLSCLVFKVIAYSDLNEQTTDIVDMNPGNFEYFWNNTMHTGMYQISINPSWLSPNTTYSQVVFKPGEGVYGLMVEGSTMRFRVN
jgi:hypothetical protein